MEGVSRSLGGHRVRPLVGNSNGTSASGEADSPSSAEALAPSPLDGERAGVRGEPARPVPRHEESPTSPISAPERFGAALLIVCAVLIGLYPRLLLDLIRPALESPLMSGLMKGGTP